MSVLACITPRPWASQVTATAEGANNCQHDSMTPMAGFVLMFNMHLGEVAFGGIGSGMGIPCPWFFIFVSVFLAGLMIGRTPEYLGKKIEGYDVKLAALLFLLLTVIVSLGATAWAVPLTHWGADNVGNGGPHGFSEILYAYSSGVANNGTAFGGYGYTPTTTVNGASVYGSKMFNITQTFVMLLGRYFQIIPVMALAGALALKKPVAVSKVGTFPVTGTTFILLITSVILIVQGRRISLASLAVERPLVEHLP